MDFLSHNLTYRSLVGAFCLIFAQFSFGAVFTPSPLFWSPTSSGSFAIPSLSSTQLQAANSTFSTVDSAVQQVVVTPVLSFAGSNALDLSGDINAIRSIPISSIVNTLSNNFADNASAFQSLLDAPNLASLLPDIYHYYFPNSSSSSLSSSYPSSDYGCGSSSYAVLYSYQCSSGSWNFLSYSSSYVFPFPTSSSIPTVDNTSCSSSNNGQYLGGGGTTYSDGTGPDASECPGGSQAGTYVSPSSTPPPDLQKWIPANWSKDDLSKYTAKALDASPSLASAVASDENDASPFPVTFPNAHPWDYKVPAADASVTGQPSISTSTNPSTGVTTKTVSTPTYTITGGPSVTVAKSVSTSVSTCTSSGTCTVSSTSTSTSTPALSPKSSSPFVPPITSTPSPQSVSVKSFALNLAMPSQSDAVCPDPLSFSALSNNFTIPLTPLCTLASDVQPYVESLGAVGAGIVIFR